MHRLRRLIQLPLLLALAAGAAAAREPVAREPVAAPAGGSPPTAAATLATPATPTPTGADAAARGGAPAAAAPVWQPAPFEASYSVRYDGLPFTVTGTRTLRRSADGGLDFSASIDTWLVSVDEQAHMRMLPDGRMRPEHYALRKRGLGGRRTRLLDFDWAHGLVHRSGDKVKTRAIPPDVYDPVSWQLALRRDLATGAGPTGTVLHYPITDGGEPKVYDMAVRGPQSLELASGPIDTVLVERLYPDDDARQTRVWLAPARDWQLVQLDLVDEDGRRVRLTLRDSEG